jgi:hypothetical protein
MRRRRLCFRPSSYCLQSLYAPVVRRSGQEREQSQLGDRSWETDEGDWKGECEECDDDNDDDDDDCGGGEQRRGGEWMNIYFWKANNPSPSSHPLSHPASFVTLLVVARARAFAEERRWMDDPVLAVIPGSSLPPFARHTPHHTTLPHQLIRRIHLRTNRSNTTHQSQSSVLSPPTILQFRVICPGACALRFVQIGRKINREMSKTIRGVPLLP